LRMMLLEAAVVHAQESVALDMHPVPSFRTFAL
jgi:hypothetical protein